MLIRTQKSRWEPHFFASLKIDDKRVENVPDLHRIFIFAPKPVSPKTRNNFRQIPITQQSEGSGLETLLWR